MKRILAFILLPFLSACVQGPMEEMPQDVWPGDTPGMIGGESHVFDAHILSPDELSVQNSNVRTALGDKVGTSYPNYWSAGDVISVNGITSLEVASEYVGDNKAAFEMASAVAAPYYFAYPAAAISGYSNGSATVTLPEKQQWLSTTYDPSAFVMMGTANKNFLEFKPMMSAVRLKVTASGRNIRSITFMTLGTEKVSGKFTTNHTRMTATQESNSYVHVVAPEGGAASGSEVYLLIPAQTYASGMAFAIRATDGTQMIYSTKSSFTAQAGMIYPLSVTYTPKETDITLMSSNVRFYSARNKNENPDAGDRDWENRKEAYFMMLNTLSPDIVGLQEAEQEQVKDIKNNCPGYSHIGYGRKSGEDILYEFSWLEQSVGKEHSESTTILYKTDKFTKHSEGKFWHSNTPDKVSTYPNVDDRRISTWAVFTHKDTGKKFFYLNTHTTTLNILEQEIILISNQVKKLNTENLPVILSADWNLVEDDSWMNPITENYSSARKTAPVTDNCYTFHWWETSSERRQIDHIYYKDLECLEFHTVNQRWNGFLVSDHYPIYAKFNMGDIEIPYPSTDVEFTGTHEDCNVENVYYPSGEGTHEEYNPVDFL